MSQQDHVNVEHTFYDDLKPRQIRLLKAASIEKLSFTLEVVSLESCPNYAALSYVWGDATLCKQILVQDKQFWITKNLFLALDQFRNGIDAHQSDEAKDKDPIGIDAKKLKPLKKRLWIDAICINQGDSELAKLERSGQVQRMTEIYETAETVYIWLGQPANEILNGLAAAKLADLEELYFRRQKTMIRKGSHRNWHRSSELTSIVRDIGTAEAEGWVRPETHCKDAWLGIVEIWKSPWWTRAWAHQEGTVPDLNFLFMRYYQRRLTPKLADTKAIFISGNAYTTWSALSVALWSTDYLIKPATSGTEVMQGTAVAFGQVIGIRHLRGRNLKPVERTLNPLEMLNRMYLVNKKSLLADPTPLDPLDILNRFRMADCKDPRDKVFAAIGLLPDIRSRLTVDYRRSTCEIYIDFITHLLTDSDGSLDFLGHTCRTENAIEVLNQKCSAVKWEAFPSWLPNWYLPLDMSPLPKMLHVQSPARDRSFGRDRWKMARNNTSSMIPAYSPCGSAPIFSRPIIEGCLLQVSGWHLDTVIDNVHFNLTDEEQTRVLTRWQQHLSATTYPEGNIVNSDLRHVYCADVKYGLAQGLNPVVRGYEIDQELLDADPAELDEKRLAEQTTMAATLRTVTAHRALCMTSNGHLGIVPHSCLAGDIIVALSGGRVLYVLRWNPGQLSGYEYIGEAYVHGIMDGEGIVDLKGEAVLAQRFTII